MRDKIILLLLFLLLLSSLRYIVAGAKVLLFVAEEFPQISIKPLHLITSKPYITNITFGIKNRIVGTLFIPSRTGKSPAVIVAMGIRTSNKDRPVILGFCESLARLGYIVFWPRQVDLEKDKIKFEHPQTFVESFTYLETLREVDIKRISFVGFSVGSSLAMVAAQDPSINRKIHQFVFFGGYYNIVDYFTSLANHMIVVDGIKMRWKPADGAISHAEKVLKQEGFTLEQFKEYSIRKPDVEKLAKYSPHDNILLFRTPIFILHEKSDSFVPYIESIKLQKSLEKKVPIVYHQAELFEHVQPKKGFTIDVAKELFLLFFFLQKLFLSL